MTSHWQQAMQDLRVLWRRPGCVEKIVDIWNKEGYTPRLELYSPDQLVDYFSARCPLRWKLFLLMIEHNITSPDIPDAKMDALLAESCAIMDIPVPVIRRTPKST